jgi:hypothetical protein
MTDKPNPPPPRQPLVLPPNFRDVKCYARGTPEPCVGAEWLFDFSAFVEDNDVPADDRFILTTDLLVHLVQEGLATATPETVHAGKRPVEVVRVRITDAGRLALAG